MQLAFKLDPLDGGVLDVAALEAVHVIAGGDVIFIDKVAVFVVEHRHVKRAFVEVAAQAGFVAFALFRLKVGVGFDDVTFLQVFEAAVQRLGGRGAETFGVLAEPGVVIVERVGHAQFWRKAVPGFFIVADGVFTVGVDRVLELLGDLGLEARVVVAHAGHEGPLIPADFVLRKQAVGVDGRVREVADFGEHVAFGRAQGADCFTASTYRKAHRAAGTRAGDLVVFQSGAIGQQMVGGADCEGFVELGIEHPLLLFIAGVAGAIHITAEREVAFFGALVGLGHLIVEAQFAVVGQQAVEREGVFNAETLACHGVIAVA